MPTQKKRHPRTLKEPSKSNVDNKAKVKGKNHQMKTSSVTAADPGTESDDKMTPADNNDDTKPHGEGDQETPKKHEVDAQKPEVKIEKMKAVVTVASPNIKLQGPAENKGVKQNVDDTNSSDVTVPKDPALSQSIKETAKKKSLTNKKHKKHK